MMGKNSIHHKNVRVHEQLYNEILNGFQGGGTFDRKEKIKNEQKKRIRAVGSIWADNERSYKFLEDVKKMLLPVKEDVLKYGMQSILIYKNYDDSEDEEEEGLEESNKGLLTFIKVIHDAHSTWKKIRTIFKVAKIAKSVIDSYKKSKTNDKDKMFRFFTSHFIDNFGNSLNDAFQMISIQLSAALLKSFESPAVQNAFIKLKEKQQELKDYVSAKLAATAFDKVPIIGGWLGPLIDTFHHGSNTWEQIKRGKWEAAAMSGLKTVGNAGLVVIQVFDKTKMTGKIASKVVAQTVKYASYVKTAANSAYWAKRGVDVALLSGEIADIVDWDEKNRQELRDWIDKDVTNKILKPAEKQIQSKLYKIHDGYMVGVQHVVQKIEATTTDVTNLAKQEVKTEEIKDKFKQQDLKIVKTSINDNLYSTDGDNKEKLPQVDKSLISWKEDDLTLSMRSSFKNRYNISVEGNIPRIESKESQSLKVLSASFVFIDNSVKKLFDVFINEWNKLSNKGGLFDGIRVETNKWLDNKGVTQKVKMSLNEKMKELELIEDNVVDAPFKLSKTNTKFLRNQEYKFQMAYQDTNKIIKQYRKNMKWMRLKKQNHPWGVGFYPNGAVSEISLDYYLRYEYMTENTETNEIKRGGAKYQTPFTSPISITKNFISRQNDEKKYHVFIFGNYNAYYNFMSAVFLDEKQGSKEISILERVEDSYFKMKHYNVDVIGLDGLDIQEYNIEDQINKSISNLFVECTKLQDVKS